MIFSRAWRIARLEREIAGKKARLAALKEFAAGIATVPSNIYNPLFDLPKEIAELETRLSQLRAGKVPV